MQDVSRRHFLQAALIAAAGCATQRTDSNDEIAIIDAHTHFYDPARPQGVPWPPKNDSVLYRRVLPEELKSISEPLGVRGTVVVEASPVIADNDWVLGLASSDPFLIGLVGHLKPGQPGFSDDLNRLARNGRFRGMRTGGWEIQLAPGNPNYMRDLRLLADRGLALDVLCGTTELPSLSKIASEIPALRMIINHCAGVRITGGKPDPAWLAAIQNVAAYPNVNMKISGLAEATGREFSAPKQTDYYAPVLETLWQAFGEDRVIFGSNWPVCTRFADYAAVLGIVRPFFEGKGKRSAAKYFRKNAQRVYGVHLA